MEEKLLLSLLTTLIPPSSFFSLWAWTQLIDQHIEREKKMFPPQVYNIYIYLSLTPVTISLAATTTTTIVYSLQGWLSLPMCIYLKCPCLCPVIKTDSSQVFRCFFFCFFFLQKFNKVPKEPNIKEEGKEKKKTNCARQSIGPLVYRQGRVIFSNFFLPPTISERILDTRIKSQDIRPSQITHTTESLRSLDAF